MLLAFALLLAQQVDSCRHKPGELSVAYRQDTLVIVVSDSMRCNISFYSLLGIQLKDFGMQQLRKGRNAISCPTLSRGIYIIVFRSDTLRIIKRIIVR